MKRAIVYLSIGILLLFGANTTVSAYVSIPENLQDVCSIAAGTKPIKSGTCKYSGYSNDIQKRVICYTSETVDQLGLYSSVCCDTQAQCTELLTHVDTQNLCGDSEACKTCMDQNNKVWTALGCIEVTPTGLINKFLPFGIGIAGGIAFLLILLGALQMMMSAGNPEKLNAGKELVTAAITGLLLIILSIFILQLVGAQILVIPGFK